jgi:uncharacterized membrane protein HdeD (DUF308 family)
MTAGVSVLLGLVIIWNPFETAALTARVIGIVLIIEGVSSAGTTIFSWHTIKHLSKVLNQTKETVKDVDSVIVEEEDL